MRLLADPQTSGGLLACVPQAEAADCLQALHVADFADSAQTGTITTDAHLINDRDRPNSADRALAGSRANFPLDVVWGEFLNPKQSTDQVLFQKPVNVAGIRFGRRGGSVFAPAADLPALPKKTAPRPVPVFTGATSPQSRQPPFMAVHQGPGTTLGRRRACRRGRSDRVGNLLGRRDFCYATPGRQDHCPTRTSRR